MFPDENHPYFGIFVKNTADILEKNGFKIVSKVVVTEPNQKSFKKLVTYFKFYRDILKGITHRNSYDLIYVHFISHSALPVLILKLFTKKKLMLNVHGSDVIIRGKIAKVLSVFSYPLVKMCDRIVVPSEFFKEVVKKKFKIKEDKIIVYPSGGINTDIFKPMEIKNKTENKNTVVLGYISRIERGKGWDIFVNVIKSLNEKYSNINFKGIMIGSGSERDKCIGLIKELDLEDKIEYLGGLSQREINMYLNLMDLFIFPTRLEESLGLVGLEAMAAKVPVLGSNVGGIRTYIKDKENGYLIDVDDVDGYVERVIEFIGLSNEQRERIIDNAYKTALKYESNYVIDRFLREINKMLEE
jgi:glycosyltransferase involved in cell wall biosynthesis